MAKKQRKDVIISSEMAGNKEHVYITDAETGEVLDQFCRQRSEKVSGKPPGGAKPHFYKVYASNLQDLIKKKHLTPYIAGVFFMCLAFVGWESNFLIHPRTGKNLSCGDLSKLLNIDREQLRRTLEKLTEKGLIATVKNGNGAANQYMLNSNVVFWGQRMKDKSEHDVFGDSCPYQPPVKMRYKERDQK